MVWDIQVFIINPLQNKYLLIKEDFSAEVERTALKWWSHPSWRDLKASWMWHLGTWFNGGLGTAGLMAGLDDLKALFWVNGSVTSQNSHCNAHLHPSEPPATLSADSSPDCSLVPAPNFNFSAITFDWKMSMPLSKIFLKSLLTFWNLTVGNPASVIYE